MAKARGTYHKWKLITPVLQKQLEETGLFQVDVVTAPPAGGDFSTFKPDFSKYAGGRLELRRARRSMAGGAEDVLREVRAGRRRFRQRACRRQRVSRTGSRSTK